MPEVDGLEATRLIRSSVGQWAVNVDTPILAMTANVFKEDRLACKEAGMEDFIAKPVEPGNLFSTIIKWLPGPSETPDSLLLNRPAVNDEMKNPVVIGHFERKGSLEVAIDPEILNRIFTDDHNAQLLLLQKFVSQANEVFAEFDQAYRQHDIERVRFHSHKLKSSARTVGANSLADLCFALETAARNLKWKILLPNR